jgi:non-ribosomal peptide synthase protein (TIGR01720 family)
VPGGVDPARLEAAAAALVAAHPVLAARLVPDGDAWALEVPPAGQHRTMAVTRTEAAEGRVRETVLAAAAGLDPVAGVMARLAWADGGPGAGGVVVLAVHHLVVDAVSWRVLGADLAAAYAAAGGDGPGVAGEPVPFGRWARLLAAQDRSAELEQWAGLLDGAVPLLPGADLDPARDTTATIRRASAEMAVPVTGALLTAVPAAFHGGPNDVLLAGLAAAVAEWRAGRGLAHGPVLVDVEGHGRAPLSDRMDLSRTVGWLTSVHPVRLDAGPGAGAGARAAGAEAGQVVKRIKEQLRAVPGDGLGYGVLRYLDAAAGPALAGLPAAQLGFNYLGRPAPPGGGGRDAGTQDAGTQDAGRWRPAGRGGDTDPALPVAHLVEATVTVGDRPGGQALVLGLAWPAALLADADARALLNAWRDMLAGIAAHAEGPGAGGHTPSDFSLAEVSQAELDEFEALAAELEKGTTA